MTNFIELNVYDDDHTNTAAVNIDQIVWFENIRSGKNEGRCRIRCTNGDILITEENYYIVQRKIRAFTMGKSV